jgi:acetyl esterase/lipase
MAGGVAAAGGAVELHVFARMWHVWPMWGTFPEALDALDRAAVFVQRVCARTLDAQFGEVASA